jgi:hypothetical protein
VDEKLKSNPKYLEKETLEVEKIVSEKFVRN